MLVQIFLNKINLLFDAFWNNAISHRFWLFDGRSPFTIQCFAWKLTRKAGSVGYSGGERPGFSTLYMVCNLFRHLPVVHPGMKLFSGRMVKDGHYVYMDHLRVLDSKRPRPEPWAMLPILSWDVYTPLCL